MSFPQEGRKYTYADYLTWHEGERWEILDGVPSMFIDLQQMGCLISLELLRRSTYIGKM